MSFEIQRKPLHGNRRLLIGSYCVASAQTAVDYLLRCWFADVRTAKFLRSLSQLWSDYQLFPAKTSAAIALAWYKGVGGRVLYLQRKVSVRVSPQVADFV